MEMELSVARAAQASSLNGSPIFIKPVGEKTEERPKAFVVIGINTAFSSNIHVKAQEPSIYMIYLCICYLGIVECGLFRIQEKKLRLMLRKNINNDIFNL